MVVIYYTRETSGWNIAVDSAVVCLGLGVLFARAMVGLQRTEPFALGAELCCFRNLI